MALQDHPLDGSSANASSKQFYSSGEVAKLFGVTQRTVANWCDQGRLPYVLTPNGHRRIPVSALAGGRDYDAKLAEFQARMAAALGDRPPPTGDEIASQVRARRRQK